MAGSGKFCPHCGTPRVPGFFCVACGAELEAPAPGPTATLEGAAKGASVARKFVCGTCGRSIDEAASAWDAMTSRGACPTCGGSGEIRLVEQSRPETVPRRSAKGEADPSIRPLWLLGQLLILIPAFVLWASAGQCGGDFAQEHSDKIERFGRFLGQLLARASVGKPREGQVEFTKWTTQARADLAKDFQEAGEGLGFTEQAAEEFRACFVEQMINALPGGPASGESGGSRLPRRPAQHAGRLSRIVLPTLRRGCPTST